MRSPCLFLFAVAIGGTVACGGGDDGVAAAGEPAAGDPSAAASLDGGATPDGVSNPLGGGATADGGKPIDASIADAKGDAKTDAGPTCTKHITVVFAVGTGAGAVASHSNGCWTVVDADGAANAQFRKCSTGKLVVENATAPNYAFDDTNPNAPLSTDQNFLSQCSAGATGDGFEYMAYRGSWRLLTAPHIKAYFAELYTTDQTIDDSYALWQTPLNGHAVSPMINIGPNDPTTIASASLKMCNRVADHGYFGVYNGAYRVGMGPTDPRALALVSSLDKCTQ